MRLGAPLAVLALLAGPVAADEADLLTGFLQDSLSDAGRVVTVTGFQGALSSVATMDKLTIADDAGIWLTLTDVELDWSQSALFSGFVQVDRLVAEELVLERWPGGLGGGTAPEAQAFALPDLPVSIEIGELAARRIVLGEAVLGEPVEASLTAALSLAGGEGRGRLELQRSDDGPEGAITLEAGYSNATGILDLALEAKEGAGGIAARLLGIPGDPAAALTVTGSGPLADFTADVALETDGVDRLSGQVALTEAGFRADLAGDLAPVFLPAYADFLGRTITLQAEGRRDATGRTTLSGLQLSTQALTLQGRAVLDPGGLPELLDITGHLGLASGGPVLLPLPGDPVEVDSADLTLRYDRATDEGWTAEIGLFGLNRVDFRADALRLQGSGRIARGAEGAVVGGTLRLAGNGLTPADPALVAALGSDLTGRIVGYWTAASGQVSLSDIALTGAGYALEARGRIGGFTDGLPLTGRIAARYDDLSRLGGLLDLGLTGQGEITARGRLVALSGQFDLEGQGQGRDLGLGIAEVDGFLRGTSVLAFSARRDETGVDLRNLSVAVDAGTAALSGRISTADTVLAGTLDLPDLAQGGGPWRGALGGNFATSGPLAELRVTLTGTGRGLAIGQERFDRLLAGESRIDLDLRRVPGQGIAVETALIRNPQVEATARGTVNGGTGALDLQARLNDLALLLPDFPGPLTLTGTARQEPGQPGAALDLVLRGPGQIDAVAQGRMNDFRNFDLQLRGAAQAGLANLLIAPRSIAGPVRFDLALLGPLDLTSLSGPVSLTGGRLADPDQTFALTDITGEAQLDRGQATLSARGRISSGGEVAVTGTVAVTPPMEGVLEVTATGVTLKDPRLYEARGSAELTVTGALLDGAVISGDVRLLETELRIPNTSFGSATPIPELAHLNEPAASRATRARAGLIQGPAGSRAGGRPFRLDLRVLAPNRVFLRGRGLDAELGGELRLFGTTEDIQPAGGFTLIRGRLDVLGRRLDLSEATLQLQGALEPYVSILAETQSDGIVSRITITGPALSPVVDFTSSPDLPDEEILARLLFDQGLQNLSALQTAQLAGAVAVLAGKSGEGLAGRIRRSTGLDNLDITTTDEGTLAVTVGKYISRKVYTEVTVDDQGKSQINLNLDVSRNVTIKGRADSDGTTGLGIFVEKDY